MITLSATLTAHQKLARRQPYLRVVAETQRAQLPLFRWTRYYTGAEADSPVAVVMGGDSSLLRARNDAGTVHHSRVASPVAGSTYSSWTSLGAVATTGTGISLATGTSESTMVYVLGNVIKVRVSLDNGASWGASSDVVNHGAPVTWVAHKYRANGTDIALFYSGASSVYRIRRTTGTWAGAGTAWTNSLASVAGIGAGFDGADFHLCVTGADASGNKRSYGCLMGDGGLPSNVWSSLNTIADADAASTSSYAGGAIVMPSLEAHVFFAQKETGGVAFNRAFYSHTPTTLGANTATWLEPEPLEPASAFGPGVTLQAAQARAWMVTPGGVWFAQLAGSTDYTSRVLSASYRVDARSLKASLVLDDSDGALALQDTANLFVGCSMRLDVGYTTSAGAEVGSVVRFAVQRIRYMIQADGRRVAAVTGDGPWEALERWSAPQAYQNAALTRQAVFSRLVAKTGFAAFSGSASAAFSGDVVSFAYAANESGRSVAERLLAVVTDQPRHDNGSFTLLDLTAADASVYTYGAGHAVSGFEKDESEAVDNWVRVVGTGRYADAVGVDAIGSVGNRLRVIRDLSLGTDAKATVAAAAALRRPKLRAIKAIARVPVNAGQELFDVVTVTYALLGVNAAVYRVIGLAVEYERSGARGEPKYELVLELGDV